MGVDSESESNEVMAAMPTSSSTSPTGGLSSVQSSSSSDDQQQQRKHEQEQFPDASRRTLRKKFLLFLTVLMKVIEEKMVRDQVKVLIKNIVRNDTKIRRRRRRRRHNRHCRYHHHSRHSHSYGHGHGQNNSIVDSGNNTNDRSETVVVPSCERNEALIEAIQGPLRALVGDSVWVVAWHYTELYSRKYASFVAAEDDAICNAAGAYQKSDTDVAESSDHGTAKISADENHDGDEQATPTCTAA